MRTDLRVKHDIDARKKAAELFWKGRGFESVAKELSIPRSAVRKWQQIWKAFGSGALLPMDGKQARHTCSQKAAAAKAVVGDGMSKSDAMARYGIMSMAPLERWCRACREGGAEAQAQGTADGVRGRGKAAHARAAARAQGAAARGRGGVPRKTAVPGRKGKDLARAKAEAVHALAQEGCRPGGLLAAAGLARPTCRYALSHPAKPARPELRERVAETFSRCPNGCGHREMAMCLRREDGVHIAGKTALRIVHGMGISCGIRREADCRMHSSCRGIVGSAFENLLGRGFAAEGPWEKMGTDVTEFEYSFGKACLAPACGFSGREIVAWSIPEHPDMAQRAEMPCMLAERLPAWKHPLLRSDMGWQCQNAACCKKLEEAGIVQGMSRKGSCLDNACTGGLFGHMKDELFRGHGWDTSETFKADLEAYMIFWNTRRRQKALGGLTLEEFRSQAA